MTAGDHLFAGHRPEPDGSHGDSPSPDAEPDDGEAGLPADAEVADGAVESAGNEASTDPDHTTRIAPLADPSPASGQAPTSQASASQAPTQADETVVMPLNASAAGAAPAASARGNGHREAAVSDEPWDTGTIRRWDPSQTDQRMASSTGPLRRPAPLDDREDVTVESGGRGSRWYEIPVMVIIALTLAFLLRTFVVQVFYIPSGSMIPTLEVNDRIAVEKLTYLTREPVRGEVIVFAGDDPLEGQFEQSTADRVLTGVGQFLGVVPVDAKDFVKRVIGLPGDTVEITDGQVSVNGIELDEPYARLDNDNGTWEVPPGMLFVMGDNRANSGDSRSTLGYIPEDDVVGRAVMVIWPFDHAGSIAGDAHDAAVDAGS